MAKYILWEPGTSNKGSTLHLLVSVGQNQLTDFIVFLVASIQSVFVCEHHGGLVRCQTPAAPSTGR